MTAAKAPALQRIGAVALASGTSISTIRYYESLGLLTPAARVSRRRQFDGTTISRLVLIRTLKSAGFTLDEIRQLLQADAAHRRTRRRLVENRLDDVRANVRRLQAIEHALLETIDCGCASLEHCERIVAVTARSPAASALPPSARTAASDA